MRELLDRKKLIAIAALALVVCAALALVLIKVVIPNQKLNEARVLIDAGDYEAAYLLLDGMDYKDSGELRDSIRLPYQKALLSKARVGSYVTFGSYEQDNDTGNGSEDIEWLVLDKQDDALLVISQYGLDCQPYNETYAEVVWETCTLRQWLNGTFLNAAFSAEEQAMIPYVQVSADSYHIFFPKDVDGTTDRVFLLNYEEANRYFDSDSARACMGTPYCYARGATKTGNGNCWWWVRSQGSFSYNAAFFRSLGTFFYYGHNVDYHIVAVRPAMWINLA